MQRKTQAVMMVAALMAFAGAAQSAGRAVDEPLRIHPAQTVGTAASGTEGMVYTGRPNDTSTVARTRGEGGAEFAVMEMRDAAPAGQGRAVQPGRSQDGYRGVIR